MKRIYKIIERIAEEISLTYVSVYAANAAFFIFLSVFPAMLVLLSITQYTIVTIEGIMALLTNLIPEALLPLLNFIIQDLSAVNPASIISLSTVLMLWAASKGVYGLVRGLNRAYHQTETRSYFRVRFYCVIYTVGVLASLVITVALYTLTQSFLHHILPDDSMLLRILSALVHYRWLVSGVILFIFFTAVYTFFPCHRNKLPNMLPGSFAATVGWLVFSALYSHYVKLAGGASSIYGGISIIAFTVLWLYFAMMILFYGAMLNHYLAEHRPQIKKWFKK